MQVNSETTENFTTRGKYTNQIREGGSNKKDDRMPPPPPPEANYLKERLYVHGYECLHRHLLLNPLTRTQYIRLLIGRRAERRLGTFV